MNIPRSLTDTLRFVATEGKEGKMDLASIRALESQNFVTVSPDGRFIQITDLGRGALDYADHRS